MSMMHNSGFENPWLRIDAVYIFSVNEVKEGDVYCSPTRNVIRPDEEPVAICFSEDRLTGKEKHLLRPGVHGVWVICTLRPNSSNMISTGMDSFRLINDQELTKDIRSAEEEATKLDKDLREVVSQEYESARGRKALDRLDGLGSNQNPLEELGHRIQEHEEWIRDLDGRVHAMESGLSEPNDVEEDVRKKVSQLRLRGIDDLGVLGGHPGLAVSDLLSETTIGLNGLSEFLEVREPELVAVVQGRKPITPKMALGLGELVGSAEAWMERQTEYDLEMARRERIRFAAGP